MLKSKLTTTQACAFLRRYHLVDQSIGCLEDSFGKTKTKTKCIITVSKEQLPRIGRKETIRIACGLDRCTHDILRGTPHPCDHLLPFYHSGLLSIEKVYFG